MNTFTLILLFLSSSTFAKQSLTVKGSFELLKGRIYPDQKFYPKRTYYNFSYKTDMPRKHAPLNTRTPWKSSGIMFFTNNKFDLTQIALYTKQCAVDLNRETKASLLQQAHELVKRETFILFGKNLNLKEQPLKKLKESHKKWNRINLKEKLPSVSKIRVSRGFYKCDGRSGIGYRVDFFIDKQSSKELSLPEVQFSGALRNFMMKSDISAKFDLRKLQKLPNLYALGAKENLKGEILILNSKVFNSSVSTDKKLSIDKNLNAKASLIVYSQVENWTESIIPDGVSKREEFEKFLEKEALKKGININQPFAFLIKGPVKTNKWHVIDWDPNDKKHTHSKHINSGLNGTLKNENVRMLGFYSKNHTGIFTHHTTNMHIHFVNKEETISGHSDNLTLGSGMRLSLPKQVKP